MHPGAVGGIQRNIAHAQQRLAVLWLRHGSLRQLEMLRAELSGGLLDQQDLTVHIVAHQTASLCCFFRSSERAPGSPPLTMSANQNSSHIGHLVANAR